MIGSMPNTTKLKTIFSTRAMMPPMVPKAMSFMGTRCRRIHSPKIKPKRPKIAAKKKSPKTKR